MARTTSAIERTLAETLQPVKVICRVYGEVPEARPCCGEPGLVWMGPGRDDTGD